MQQNVQAKKQINHASINKMRDLPRFSIRFLGIILVPKQQKEQNQEKMQVQCINK